LIEKTRFVAAMNHNDGDHRTGTIHEALNEMDQPTVKAIRIIETIRGELDNDGNAER
jgi:hypothetical protein